jgi:hypothetical protein
MIRDWRKKAMKFAKLMGYGGEVNYFPPNTTMPLDYEGNALPCHCGKVATCGILGPMDGSFWCTEHCPIEKTLEKLGMV